MRNRESSTFEISRWTILVLAVLALVPVAVWLVVHRQNGSSTGPITVASPAASHAAGSGWSDGIKGTPALFRGPSGKTLDDPNVPALPGVHLWLGYDGWHLRVVSGAAIGTIQGTVSCQGRARVDSVTGADRSVASAKGGTLTLALPAAPTTTGVNFTMFCKKPSVTVDLRGPHGEVQPDSIRVGSQSDPARSNPITFTKY